MAAGKFQGAACEEPVSGDQAEADPDRFTAMTLNFIVNGTDIRRFGSQGQQRNSSFFKTCGDQAGRKIVKDYPVLLLDDVLSELDSKRQEHFYFQKLPKFETLDHMYGLDEFVNNKFGWTRFFKIDLKER